MFHSVLTPHKAVEQQLLLSPLPSLSLCLLFWLPYHMLRPTLRSLPSKCHFPSEISIRCSVYFFPLRPSRSSSLSLSLLALLFHDIPSQPLLGNCDDRRVSATLEDDHFFLFIDTCLASTTMAHFAVAGPNVLSWNFNRGVLSHSVLCT